MQVTRQLGLIKHRSYVRVSRVAPNVDICPFDHKLSTLERAVKERVFFVKDATAPGGFAPPPQPEIGYFGTKMGDFRSSLNKHVRKTAPWTYTEFVQSYEGRKRTVYEEALVELREGYGTIEEDAQVHVFIKNEKTDRTTKQDPVPRVISPRSPKYNLRVGRFLKKIEHRVFKAIGDLFEHPTVMKGYDIHRTASLMREKWEMLDNPVAIGLDASRFDQHVSIEALQFEHSMYMDWFATKKDRVKLARLLRLQEKNHCVGYTPDGIIKYTTEGTRMSGDMNTSLGNCILMCGMIWTFLRERGIKGHLANNGDDCVVFVEKRDLEKFSIGLSDWFIKLGFNMVVEEPVQEFEQIEFCQTKPIFDGISWVMCRNPHTAIPKDATMLDAYQNSPGKFLGWLDAVGIGGLSMTGGLPVFQSFYRMYVRSGKKRKISPHLMSWNMRRHLKVGTLRREGEVSPDARASFYWAFGMTPDEQIELENYYDGMTITSDLAEVVEPRGVFPDL
nr:RNA polymerase [Flumine tombus-like virus 14]